MVAAKNTSLAEGIAEVKTSAESRATRTGSLATSISAMGQVRSFRPGRLLRHDGLDGSLRSTSTVRACQQNGSDGLEMWTCPLFPPKNPTRVTFHAMIYFAVVMAFESWRIL
jgi:hypothetical protein